MRVGVSLGPALSSSPPNWPDQAQQVKGLDFKQACSFAAVPACLPLPSDCESPGEGHNRSSSSWRDAFPGTACVPSPEMRSSLRAGAVSLSLEERYSQGRGQAFPHQTGPPQPSPSAQGAHVRGGPTNTASFSPGPPNHCHLFESPPPKPERGGRAGGSRSSDPG